MTTEQLSIRMTKETLRRLDAESKRERMSRSELARTFIEEALRMEAHRGIVFKPGAAGRRPSLAAGPDVWEIVRAWRDLGVPEAEAIPRLAEIASVSEYEIRTAFTYYFAYPEEIDAWIEQANAYADSAYEEWKRQQAHTDR